MAGRRVPTAIQLLRWVAAVFKMELVELLPDADAYAAQAAIDEALEAPDGITPRDDLIGVLTLTLSRLLCDPVVEARRRRLAVGAVELICLLNGFKLTLTDGERTALVEESARAADPAVLRSWLSEHICALSPGEAAAARMRARRSFGSPYLGRPRLFLALPGRGVPPEVDEGIRLAAHQIRFAAQDVASSMASFSADLDGIEKSSPEGAEGAIIFEAPGWEERWCRDPEESCRINRDRLGATNVFVELGYGGGSHSNGVELMLTPPDAQFLYLAFGDSPLPHAVEGRLAMRETCDERIGTWQEAAQIFAAFLRERWSRVERSWRMAEVRELVYRPLADDFRRLFAERPPGQAEEILGRCNYSGYRSALESPHGVAHAGLEVINRVAAAFGSDVDAGFGRGTPRRLSNDELDALDDYTDRYVVAASVKKSLRREAESRIAAGAWRRPLTVWGLWRDFHGLLIAEAA